MPRREKYKRGEDKEKRGEGRKKEWKRRSVTREKVEEEEGENGIPP